MSDDVINSIDENRNRVNRSYDEDTSKIMSYIYLHHTEVSVKDLAVSYGILNRKNQPNHSYARQLIHRFLKKRNNRLWVTVDGESAKREENSPSRAYLSISRNKFFPDLEEREDLRTIALVFLQKHLINKRNKTFDSLYINNKQMHSVKEQLSHCDKEKVDQAIDGLDGEPPSDKEMVLD